MRISDNGLNLIKRFEGCKLTAYKPVQSETFFTIGYGHYGPDVKAGMKITQEQADAYLRQDVSGAENSVMKYDSKYHWNQNQFDALVSFTYNCGSGNLKTLLASGTRSISEISAKITAYNKGANKKVLQGLVTRRNAEKELFDRKTASSQTTPTPSNPTTPKPSGNNIIRLGQQHSIDFTKKNIGVDGIRGPETIKQQIRVLQKGLNLDYDAHLDVDGIWGKKTRDALGTHYVELNEKQYMVTVAEILCMMHGIDPNGVERPGTFGGGLERATNASKLTHDWFENMARN